MVVLAIVHVVLSFLQLPPRTDAQAGIEAFAHSSHLVAEGVLADRNSRPRWLVASYGATRPASSSTLARKLEPIVTLVIAYRDRSGTSGGPS